MKNDDLIFDDMLDEMIYYDPYATIFGKARRVYILCVRQGHLEIAKRVWNKYSKYKSQQSDLVTAFGFLLNAHKK